MELNLNINLNDSKKFKINFLLISILLIATFLRFYHLGFQNAWLDEIHTLKESDPNLTFSEFHQIIMFREGIPHFYFLIIKYASQLIGIHNIYLCRLLSVISGILSVYFIYLLGSKLFTKNTGHIAAILLTFNVLHIEYSQEARSYSLLTLLTIISFYRLTLFIKDTNLKNAIFLGFFTGLITNAHPIGLLGFASIYLILLFAIILFKEKRVSLFKFSFVSGIISLLVFSPVYQIVAKTSKIKSFWVDAPTFENIKLVFVNLSGKSEILLYVIILAIIFIFINLIISSKQQKLNLLSENKLFFCFLILFVWLFIEILILLIKSYSGTSMILNRYFIAIMPCFMLLLALGVEIITNKFFKIIICVSIISLMIIQVLIPNNYYTTITKSQFSKVCNEVLLKNKDNQKIVSSWGWLLSFYLDRDNKLKNVNETNLESYLQQVKDHAVEEESFWYIDGNSRPFKISPEIQDFVSNNYVIQNSIEHNDAWAKYFISKKIKPIGELNIELSKFSKSNFDAIGRLMFFENLKMSYPEFNLQAGKYILTIIGNSLPAKPINNENAKMNVYINQVLIKSLILSEKLNSEIKLDFKYQANHSLFLELEFINDISDKKNDRNIQISKINLKKVK